MSGEVALLFIALAQQLKQMARLIEEQTGMIPPQLIPLPVTITPEISEPVFDIKYFSGVQTEYTEIFSYKVPSGYKFYLSEVGIAPEDQNTKAQGRFMIRIAGKEVKDLRLIVPVDVDFFWLQLFEGSVVSVHYKSNNASTVCGNALYSGRLVKVPPVYPKI